ncbi:MAG: hypothetical protein AB7K68_15985 [Bacteriovoracia bacterium]
MIKQNHTRLVAYLLPFLLSLAPILLLSACPQKKELPKVSAVSETENYSANPENTLATDFFFAPAQIKLSPENKERLLALVEEAGGKEKIEKFEVVNWAELEKPSAEAIALAELRNEEIRKFLRENFSGLPVQSKRFAKRESASTSTVLAMLRQ